MTTLIMAIIFCGLLGVVYGVWASKSVMDADPGNERMREIASAIQEGAGAYLKRQYATISVVGVIIFVLVAYLLDPIVAIGFAIGAILSGIAGFVGMLISVRANVRTAQAASEDLSKGLTIAFKAGSVTGMLVAALALLAVSIYFFILTNTLNHSYDSRAVSYTHLTLPTKRIV